MMVFRWLYWGSLGLFALALVACGAGSESALSLEGTWKTGCLSDAAGQYRVVSKFTVRNFETSTESFKSDKCNDKTFITQTDSSGTFELGAADTRPGVPSGTHLLTWKIDGRTEYDIVQIQDGTLRFGNSAGRDVTIEANRPVSLSATALKKD